MNTTGATSGTGTATFPEHLSSPRFCWVRVTRSLVSCVCFVDRCLSFCPFSFVAIVLSSVLRFTDSDYHFGIFKLFLRKNLVNLVLTILQEEQKLTEFDPLHKPDIGCMTIILAVFMKLMLIFILIEIH
jgi:hypothetical protein